MKYYKGRFRPKNPSKYLGNPTNIIYRSLWEFRVMRYLDSNESILEWASEEFSIPYRSKLDGRTHRYYPDFFVKMKDKEGNIQNRVIEIKPLAQTKPPTTTNKITRRYINEVATYGINISKWEAAAEYCKDRGWEFCVITEKELGIK